MARILIVEDDENVLQVLLRYFGAVQHEAEPARSLAEGISAIQAEHWDVVLADRMLPDGDGATLGEVCPRTTAFLTMTGQEHWSADIYKPFTLADLGAAIHRKLEDR